MNKKKTYTIAYGIEFFYPSMNGIITTSLNLLCNLRDLGHNPIIFTPQIRNETQGLVQGIPIYYIPSKALPYYPNLRKIHFRHPLIKEMLVKHKVDMVHITAPWTIGKALYHIAKKHGIARIHSYHTNLHVDDYLKYAQKFFHIPMAILRFYAKHIFWLRFVLGHYFHDSHVITSPSVVMAKELASKFPKIETMHIHNGVDISKLQATPDVTLLKSLLPQHFNRHTKYVIYVGRLGIEKSIDVLLHGFAQAKKDSDLQELQLLIIGEGPQKNELQALSKILRLEQSVYFLGSIPYDTIIKSGIISKAFLFCTASTSESGSMTVTEAICCKIPVLLADHPSMTKLAKELAHYFLQNDASSLSKEILRLVKDTALYQSYIERFKTYHNIFDGREVAQRYEQAYHKAYSIAHNKE